MQKLYIVSRTVHRTCVLLMLVSTLVMSGTGAILRFPTLIPGVDTGMARAVHNTMSVYFSAILIVMGITGSVMYFYPWYMKRKANSV